MFSPRIAVQALKRPMQTFANNLVRSRLEEWRKKDPQLYREAMALVSGKTDEQLRVIADGLAGELGIDIRKVAGMFGVEI